MANEWRARAGSVARRGGVNGGAPPLLLAAGTIRLIEEPIAYARHDAACPDRRRTIQPRRAVVRHLFPPAQGAHRVPERRGGRWISGAHLRAIVVSGS